MSVELTVLHCDGSCLGNPGPGAWSVFCGDECWGAGSEKRTTNNRMELVALCEAVERAVDRGALPAVVRSDSLYALRGALEWLPRWKREGWRTRSGDVKNRDLWERLDRVMRRSSDVRLEWVRGHGDPRHDRADAEARRVARAAPSLASAASSATPLGPRPARPARPLPFRARRPMVLDRPSCAGARQTKGIRSQRWT
jgi:ribonuclease HI